MRTFDWLVAVSAVALVGASCRTPEGPVAPQGPTPVGTLREVMRGIVEYNAFKIFDAVAITVSSEGTTEKEPRTEEEWDDVLHAALTLAESPNLLVNIGEEGRAIAAAEDMDTAAADGELTPNQIQARIDANRELWLKHLTELQNVGRETMDIVNRKDAAALFDIGEKIDRVCEACHLDFWYSETP